MCSHWRVILHLSPNLETDVKSPPDDRRRSYDVISNFQDGGHTVKNLHAASGLVTASFLKKWKSTWMPNFDEIFHCTAQIKLLPVSENEAAILESCFLFRF